MLALMKGSIWKLLIREHFVNQNWCLIPLYSLTFVVSNVFPKNVAEPPQSRAERKFAE